MTFMEETVREYTYFSFHHWLNSPRIILSYFYFFENNTTFFFIVEEIPMYTAFC